MGWRGELLISWILLFGNCFFFHVLISVAALMEVYFGCRVIKVTRLNLNNVLCIQAVVVCFSFFFCLWGHKGDHDLGY